MLLGIDKSRGVPRAVTQMGGDEIKHKWVGREQGKNKEVKKEQGINLKKEQIFTKYCDVKSHTCRSIFCLRE